MEECKFWLTIYMLAGFIKYIQQLYRSMWIFDQSSGFSDPFFPSFKIHGLELESEVKLCAILESR